MDCSFESRCDPLHRNLVLMAMADENLHGVLFLCITLALSGRLGV